MRPLAITMTAFGPFTGTERIDFRPALRAGFVLIHGRTGAGKSTVLDAMCHALYGSTTTEGRTVDRMRSQLADPRTATEVVLDFELRGAAYRVHRRPPWERRRQRGEGMTSVPGEATLWDRSACTTDDQEGTPLATGETRVTEAIRGLLGFSADQFRQVMLLPQGKVREFLIAGSQQREDVLKVLFGTQRFESFAGLLKARRIELTRAVESARESASAVLATVGIATRDELAEMGSRLNEEAQALEHVAVRSRQDLESASALLARELATARLHAELDDATKAAIAAANEVEGLAARHAELDRARAARTVDPASTLAELRATEAARVAESGTKAQADARLAASLLAEAQTDLARAREAASKCADLTAEAARLEGLVPVAEQFADARARAEGLRADLAKSESSRDSATRELASVTAEADALSSRLTALSGEASRLPEHEAALERTRAWRRLLADRATAAASVREASMRRDAASLKVNEAQAAHAHAIRGVEETRARWSNGRAAAIAANLREGQPCPVCGSIEHPAPAGPSPSTATDAELARAEESLRQASDQVASARENLARLVAEAAAASDQESSLERRLGTEFPSQSATDPAALEAELEAAVRSSQGALKARDDARSKEEKLRQRLPDLQAKVESLRGESERIRLALAAADSAAETCASRLPGELGAPGALRQKVEALRADVARKEADLARAAGIAERRAAKAAHAEANAQTASGALEAAQLAAGAASAELLAALARAGFDDASDYQSARRDEKAERAIEAHISRVREVHAAARDRESRARDAVLGLEPPDVAGAEAREGEARRRASEAEAALGAARERLDALRRVAEQIGSLARQEADAQSDLDAIGPIAHAADGRPPNLTGINLQRWILGAMFDDVLVDATIRLRELSRGRYRIHRAVERRHRGQAFGLDLEVEDAWTGQSRPVATLSGGESFQAALALALGLADNVQRQAGGIELGALFIDEGFGSLDRESLDDAIDLLRGLRVGNRLVGIVSHVAELQALIDTRLEVVAGTRGSSTRWHAP